MTDATDLETIKQAINYLDLRMMPASAYEEKLIAEALAVLERIEGMVLPELPDGWKMFDLCQTINPKGWHTKIINWDVQPSDQKPIDGSGPTPRAAVLSAVKKIGG
jgi:hypothetical protein